MTVINKGHLIAATLVGAMALTAAFAQTADPLPSWNEGHTKHAIVTFVSKVTKKGAPEFVPPGERIATFDNDGTLWVEQPSYFQIEFAVDRMKALAPAHPEWKEQEPFKSVLAGDLKAALVGGHRSLNRAAEAVPNLPTGVTIGAPTPPPSAYDFKLEQYGGRSVSAGSRLLTGLTVTLLAGTDPIGITPEVLGLPRGAVGSFPDLTKFCCGTRTYVTAGSMPVEIRTVAAVVPGTYPITLKATAPSQPGITRTVTFDLVVRPAPVAVTPPTNLTFPPIPELELWKTHMLDRGQYHCNEAQMISVGMWEGGVWYYDGSRVYQQIAAYLNDPKWLDCAKYVRTEYRDKYVVPNTGGIPAWRIFPHGMAQDFVARGDETSKAAVLALNKNASFAGAATPWAWAVKPGTMRELAYNVGLYLLAEQLGATIHPNRDAYVDLLLSQFDQWVIQKEGGKIQPFMVGLASEALIAWHEKTGDLRVIPALKAVLDETYATRWDAATRSFIYTGDPPDADAVTQDLNLLIVPAYAWLYRQTGDVKYRDIADQAFASGVKGAWLDGGKQFSQNYRWSFAYVKWRTAP